jgi:hypothetical protein
MEDDKRTGQLIVSTLLKDLPAELDLNHYFDGHPQVDDVTCSCLLTHPSTVATGHLGAILAHYGIFPAQIVDILVAISRTITRFQREHHLSGDTPIRVGGRACDDPPTIGFIKILGEVVNVTDLESVIAYRLLMWLYAVAEIKPMIIPGFIFKREAPYWWALPGGLYPYCVNDLYEPWSHTGLFGTALRRW